MIIDKIKNQFLVFAANDIIFSREGLDIGEGINGTDTILAIPMTKVRWTFRGKLRAIWQLIQWLRKNDV